MIMEKFNVDFSEKRYDELEDLRDDILDEMDYYPEGSAEHEELYLQLEDVYAEMKRRMS